MVLHQCIRPLVGALLRAIMDISARAISLADRPQPSHSGFAYAGKTDPPSSSQILSQTSAGEKVATSSIALLLFESSFVRAGRRSFVPACARTTAPRAEDSPRFCKDFFKVGRTFLTSAA